MPALALMVVGNFAGYAVAGPNGLFAWGGYHRNLNQRKAELARLEADRMQLRHRSLLLDPRKADPDMADELVRREIWAGAGLDEVKSSSAGIRLWRGLPLTRVFL